MRDADGWAICRVGYVETARAIGLTAGKQAVSSFAQEWPAFTVVEVDQLLVEHAASLALANDLRSIDALHLAACLLLSEPEATMITWDRRLHAAARNAGLAVAPDVVV